MITLAISSRGWPSSFVGSLSGLHKREIAKKTTNNHKGSIWGITNTPPAMGVSVMTNT